ncbi:MAG: serine hydrolase [Bacteroidota bacterium]
MAKTTVERSMLLALTVFLFTSFLPAQEQDQDIVARASSFLDQLEKHGEFTGSVLFAEEDEILIHRGLGFANASFEVANNKDTKYSIASIVKMFTAVAVLQLHEQGKIDLQKEVGFYLPDYANEAVKNQVTIEHLLTHQAGTTHSYDKDFFAIPKDRFQELNDFRPLFEQDTLIFTPGSRYFYNDTGFLILGLVIEQVSGMSYYQYVADHIFAPAGMSNTGAFPLDEVVANRAVGYRNTGTIGAPFRENIYFITKGSSAAGFYATTEDLYRFSRALVGNKLLEEATTQLMLTPKVEGYNTFLGYGIDIDTRGASQILGHSGGWYGIRGEVMIFNELGKTVVVLSNRGDNGYQIVMEFFKNLLTGSANNQLAYRETEEAINKAASAPDIRDFVQGLSSEQRQNIVESQVNTVAFNKLYNGHFEAGLKLLRLNAMLFPESVAVWKNQGRVQLDLGDRNSALESYKAGAALDPTDTRLQELVDGLEKNRE